METKAGCGLGLDDAALKDLLRRLHELGYSEARSIDDASELGTMQYLQCPDRVLESLDGVHYWKVAWRQL